MKKFSDLKQGDKIFEIFENGNTGIYELNKVDIIPSNVCLFVDTIIGGFDRQKIGINDKIYKQSCFYSYLYDSVVFADEKEFLQTLENDEPLFNFM